MEHSKQEIVYEGWLTKSPPTKRIWRAKWRRRWFALRQSSDLPGQYFLEYYADRNCRKLKGTIQLDLCEQVDAGLYMERSGAVLTGTGNKLRGSVFSVKTHARTYHLEADTEEDMERWVNAICSVCGLRSTDDKTCQIYAFAENGNGDDTIDTIMGDFSSPYIPISECITGVRMSQDNNPPRTFTFNGSLPDGAGISTRSNNNDRARDTETGSDDSLSDDESNISLNISGPPVPPRPPKTFRFVKDGTHDVSMHRDRLNVQRTKTSITQDKKSPILLRESPKSLSVVDNGRWIQQQRAAAMSNYINTSPGKKSTLRHPIESPGFPYFNMPCSTPPPVVDRKLKPRHTSCSAINIQHFLFHSINPQDKLQYLDLDLPASPKASTSKQVFQFTPEKRAISHGKSLSVNETDMSEYKQVDFVKTEAFNITRQDAEARNKH